MKKVSISLTGSLGAGKSTVGRMLADRLQFKFFNAGQYFRDIAEDRHISVTDVNYSARTDKNIDLELDRKVAEVAALGNYVLDSRLAFYTAPLSFKVYLYCSPEVAAARVLHDTREGEHYNTINDAIAGLEARSSEERSRYKSIYGVDYGDVTNYDIVVDTTYIEPKEVVSIIVKEYYKYLECDKAKLKYIPAYISLYNLIPTQLISGMNDSLVSEYIRILNNVKSTTMVSELKPDKVEEIYAPIRIASKDNKFYVLDGHHRFIAIARAKNSNCIMSCYLDRNKACVFIDVLTKSQYYDWCSVLGFDLNVSSIGGSNMLDEYTRAKISADYTFGKSINQIVKEYGVTESQVRAELKLDNVKIRNSGNRVTDDEAIIRDKNIFDRYKSGEPISSIASDYGLSEPRVKDIIKNMKGD